jgi:antitoxin ChpS
MTTVSIRRQGGVAVMTIPAEVLKTLGVDVGSKLEVTASGDGFTARPQSKPARRRYSLRELLRGATPKTMRRLTRETAWAREGGPVGREL